MKQVNEFSTIALTRGEWRTRSGEKAVIFGLDYYSENRMRGRIGGRAWTDGWCLNGIWSPDAVTQSKDDIVSRWVPAEKEK